MNGELIDFKQSQWNLDNYDGMVESDEVVFTPLGHQIFDISDQWLSQNGMIDFHHNSCDISIHYGVVYISSYSDSGFESPECVRRLCASLGISVVPSRAQLMEMINEQEKSLQALKAELDRLENGVKDK